MTKKDKKKDAACANVMPSDRQKGSWYAHLDTGLAERVPGGPGMAAIGTYIACCVSVPLLVCAVAQTPGIVEYCAYDHLRVQGP